MSPVPDKAIKIQENDETIVITPSGHILDMIHEQHEPMEDGPG